MKIAQKGMIQGLCGSIAAYENELHATIVRVFPVDTLLEVEIRDRVKRCRVECVYQVNSGWRIVSNIVARDVTSGAQFSFDVTNHLGDICIIEIGGES